MIDYTILVPRCQAFYSKIFLYFLSSQFFPFGFPERRCAAPSPNADTKTRLPLAPHLQHSRTASLPPARKPQRGQTANSPCGAGRKGSTLSHRERRGLARRCVKCRPQVREVRPGSAWLFNICYVLILENDVMSAAFHDGNRGNERDLGLLLQLGMVSAPQLHMVDLTLLSVRFTLSFRLPA